MSRNSQWLLSTFEDEKEVILHFWFKFSWNTYLMVLLIIYWLSLSPAAVFTDLRIKTKWYNLQCMSVFSNCCLKLCKRHVFVKSVHCWFCFSRICVQLGREWLLRVRSDLQSAVWDTEMDLLIFLFCFISTPLPLFVLPPSRDRVITTNERKEEGR